MSRPNNPRLFDYYGPSGPEPSAPGTEVTLRDLFAAFALAGHLGNGAVDEALERAGAHFELKSAAAFCYQMADAMLIERAK